MPRSGLTLRQFSRSPAHLRWQRRRVDVEVKVVLFPVVEEVVTDGFLHRLAAPTGWRTSPRQIIHYERLLVFADRQSSHTSSNWMRSRRHPERAGDPAPP